MTAKTGSGVFADWSAVDATLVNAIADLRSRAGKKVLIGIAGAQGSGKTTLVQRLAVDLEQRGLPAAVLSLDDFYLPKAAREDLARSVHPLCATRGVPGTHDVKLLERAIDDLITGAGRVTIPSFDKAIDDRGEPHTLSQSCDIVLLEGWCIGAVPQDGKALAEPANALEREEDIGGRWRGWANGHLASDYARLFARVDMRIFLRAPDFAVVEGWRAQQEAALGARAMDRTRLRRFVAHYERISRAMLDNPPADIVVELDAARRPSIRP